MAGFGKGLDRLKNANKICGCANCGLRNKVMVLRKQEVSSVTDHAQVTGCITGIFLFPHLSGSRHCKRWDTTRLDELMVLFLKQHVFRSFDESYYSTSINI